MYKAQESAYKQLVREKLYKKITTHIPFRGDRKNFVTLSNTALWLERRLRDTYKEPVTCYERDKVVFKELENLPDMKWIYPVCDDIFNYNCKAPISFMWLDFCNSYTDDFMTKIVTFVGTINWSKRAVLSITLNRKRGKKNENMEYNKYFPNYKDQGFVKHITPFIKGQVLKVDRMQYTCLDTNLYGGNMNVFTFLINSK